MSDAKYFQTTKKGEIRELKDDLNSTNREKIKEAIKKIIAAMTVGKDVSMLFTDVIKSMGTENIELKKLIYLYIINYARSQPEKAILVVSMFCKDATNHPNPLIRALALRTMGCIRVDRITEYLCDPLAIALKDEDAYVRKTAAICVAKFYDMNAELVTERGFLERLRDLLSDSNPMVVANAVASLTEICETSGKDYFKIDNQTLSKLLTALNECTEWGRVFIMEALSKFEAKGNTAKQICERVIPQLAHGNSAVVMGAVKIIIKFMERVNDKEKYCNKLAAPLLTMVSESPPEIQYVALRNIDLIAQRYPQIFAKDIRIFYVKYNEEVYVKRQKLEILVKLATPKNVSIILKEFETYAQEIDISFVKRSVRGIGRIAIKLDSASEACVQTLSKLIKTKVTYIVQEAVIVVKNIFRRYPRKYEKIIVTLCDNLSELTEPEAKASMIWIIGEYAQRIIDAKDRLQFWIDSFESEPETVQLQLLTAIIKLFLKKPDKSKELVQRVLHLATEQSNNPDLRDRGYVYWRLLSTDPSAARRVVLADRPVITDKAYINNNKDLSQLLNNLCSLSSVYHCKPNEFTENHNSIELFPFHKSDSESCTSSSESFEPETEEIKQNTSAETVVKVIKPVMEKRIIEIDPKGNSIMDELFKDFNTSDGKSDNFVMVFDANKGDGLEMSIAFEKRKGNNTAVMGVQCVNRGNDIIHRIDIKFNKNYLGIQPIESLPLNGSIKPGESQTVDLGLQLMQEPTVMRDILDTNVQIAVRIVRTAVSKQKKAPKIVMFAANISAHIFFENSNDSMVKDRNLFLAEWKSESVNEIKKIFDIHNKEMSAVNVKQIFEKNSFLFVIERMIPNRGISLYFVTVLKNVSVLLELSIANNGKCRIVAKSRNKYFSDIVSETGISLIKSNKI